MLRRAVFVFALGAGCNVRYELDGVGFVDVPASRDVRGFDVRLGLDIPRAPTTQYGPQGAPCDGASRLCLPGLDCVLTSCVSPARICANLHATCEPGGSPVCSCDGQTLANRCAAVALARGIAWEGACSSRPDAAMDGAVDATVVPWTDAPPAGRRCQTGGCLPGQRCCLARGSDYEGMCIPTDSEVCR